jgi:hypothetical protein
MLPPTTAEAGATRWLPRGHLLLGLLLASSASCLLRFLGGLLHRTIEQKRDLKLTDREIERSQSDRESTGDWEREELGRNMKISLPYYSVAFREDRKIRKDLQACEKDMK